jgi:hypothetical protein
MADAQFRSLDAIRDSRRRGGKRASLVEGWNARAANLKRKRAPRLDMAAGSLSARLKQEIRGIGGMGEPLA